MPEALSRSSPAAEDATSETTFDEEILSDPVKRAEWLEEVLCKALDMEEDDARFITGVVLDHFGQKRELLDDELPSDVRSIFYTLQSKRILTFRRIEYENEEGATLRGFFWRFNIARIKEHLEEPAEDEEDGVYAQLPESCWDRGAAS